MIGAGVERLAGSRLQRVRALRVWVAGLAAFVALGLVALAARTSVEPSRPTLKNFQMAATPPAAVFPDSAASVEQLPRRKPARKISLRPAFQPADRSIPTTRWITRNAGLRTPLPARKY